MSHLYYDNNIITFEPGKLEHSSDSLNIPTIESFWCGYYNQVSQAYQVDPSFYHQFLLYSSYYPSTMDTETLVIGSNTRNGRVIKPESERPRRANKKGDGRVDVYTNGVFIRQVPFKVLVRFSKATAEAFPKKTNEAKAASKVNATKSADKAKEKDSATDWADDNSDIPEVAKELKKLNLNNNTSAGKSFTRPGKSSIDFKLDSIYIQPPTQAYEFAFSWMNIAKEAGHGDAVLNFGVSDPEHMSLEKMVDLYAVALILDLRPAPHKHRFELLTKMTDQKPTLATLKYVHERLPVHDVVVTRFITSYFEHRDRPGHAYTDAELQAIEDYVCTMDVALHTRFKEIGDSRAQKSKYLRKRREEARLEKATEEYLNASDNVQSGGIEFMSTGAGEQEKGQKKGGSGGNSRRGGGRKQ